jgi:lipoyl(octanoyl) transferase
MKPSPLNVVYAGRVGYERGLAWQAELEQQRLAHEIPDQLLVLEHPSVITLGHRAAEGNVLASPEFLRGQGIEVHRVNRGGDVTYHGPGQIVLYAVAHLDERRIRVADFVWALEEAMIRTAAAVGVDACRQARRPGVFVNYDKVGAVGIHVSRGVTTHGLALNVDPQLEHFNLIVPCGLRDHGVTSLQSLVHDRLRQADLAQRLVSHLVELLRWYPLEEASKPGGRPGPARGAHMNILG